MKNVIITGITGMIGGLVLDNCLKRDDVNNITTITRRKTGINHPKLIEVIHDDFLDYSKIKEQMRNQDVCIYCLGVYSGQVSEKKFKMITVDYTKAFGEALKLNNEKTTFCFLSGQGADPKEKSRIMFARDKGTAENMVLNLGFEKTYIIRPGYIYPNTPRKEPNFSYRLMRLLYKPILSKIYPNIGISSEDLAEAMVEIGLNGGKKIIYENKDIRQHSTT